MTNDTSLPINQVIQGDCLEVMKSLPAESIDLVIADFPYNISDYGRSITKVGSDFKKADFGEWDKFTSVEEYTCWMIEVMREINRLLKPKHQVYIFCDNHYAGYYTYHIERKVKPLQQKCPIVLYKRNPIPQMFKRNFRSSFDLCILFTKDVDKKCEPFNFLSQKVMKNVQEYNLKKLTKHPTEKNLEIIERFIKISSNRGDVVLDPFLGSGTTAVGCIKLGRSFIGIELKPEFVEMAKERIRKYLGQESYTQTHQEKLECLYGFGAE